MFKSPQTLMVQGTTSDAGKSILVTAICRILARKGIRVAPFKPQNMALNSAVTNDGGEIGRAQAVQAEACFLEPSVYMNPVLLKPNSDIGAQVIVLGKAVGNLNAGAYHEEKPNLLGTVIDAHNHLLNEFDAVIVEGAGSPAEINLRDRDIANMGFAEEADCPVIIVADIDRGGVFAHLVGTYDLLSESEKKRIVGFVINRFRGDIKLLEPGLDWLEQRLKVPVLGVIPYIENLHIEAEDAIDQHQLNRDLENDKKLNVVVPVYPRISNHTDFDVLRIHPNVNCQFIKDPQEFSGADLIVLPGTKNVRADLTWLKDSGWADLINMHLRYGGKVIGICGGYQMLGEFIHDPKGIESSPGSSEGLGFLDFETTLKGEKTLRNIEGKHLTTSLPVKGYEIHAGTSVGKDLDNPLFSIASTNTKESESSDELISDGCVNEDNNVMGTYIHGLFDSSELLSYLLSWAGFKEKESFSYSEFREEQIERLADEVEKVLSFDSLSALLHISDPKQSN